MSDPGKHEVTLKYGGGGVGPGIGVKLPKAATKLIQRLIKDFVERELSGGVGPFSFASSGTIYVTRWCNHPDLTRDDFKGGCIFGEINVGLVKSRSITVFLVGMNLAVVMDIASGRLSSFVDLASIPPRGVIIAKGTGLGVGIAADLWGYDDVIRWAGSIVLGFCVAVLVGSSSAIAGAPGDTPELSTKFANTGKPLDALLNDGFKVVSSHLGIDTIGFVLERQGKWVTCSLRNSDHGASDQMLAQCFAMN